MPPNFGVQRCSQYTKRYCDSVNTSTSNGSLETTRPNETFTVRGYTPTRFGKVVSLVKTPNDTVKKMTTDEGLLVIPANAIVEKVSFFGHNNFATTGYFTIGLGQLNNSILAPLIEEATAEIANERVGGCRDFTASNSNGKNPKILVLVNSHVNIATEELVTSGLLMVEIVYRIKPTLQLT